MNTAVRQVVLWIVIIAGGVLFWSLLQLHREDNPDYATLVKKIEAREIQEAVISDTEVEGKYTNGKPFRTAIISGVAGELMNRMREKDIKVQSKPATSGRWLTILLSYLPFVLLIGFAFRWGRLDLNTAVRQVVLWIVIIAGGVLFWSLLHRNDPLDNPDYATLVKKIEAREIQEAVISDTEVEGKYTNGKPFRTDITSGVAGELMNRMREKDIKVQGKPATSGRWLTILLSYLPVVLLIGFVFRWGR